MKLIHNYIRYDQLEQFNKIIRNIFPNICEVLLYELVQKDIQNNTENYDAKLLLTFEDSLNCLEREIDISVYTNMINLQIHEDIQFTHSMMYLFLKICNLFISRNQYSTCYKFINFYEGNLNEILERIYNTKSFNLNDKFLVKSNKDFIVEITNESIITFYLYFIRNILNCFFVLKNLHNFDENSLKLDKFEAISLFFKSYHYLQSQLNVKEALIQVDILFNEALFSMKDMTFFCFKIVANYLIKRKDKL